ncbi:MAG: hypothetical protein AB1568_12650 [Thermodesulfobacteriota bacterium]
MKTKFLRFLGGPGNGEKPPAATICPSCGYVPDRPHTLLCPRCRAEIPGAGGCTGCGRCRKNS